MVVLLADDRRLLSETGRRALRSVSQCHDMRGAPRTQNSYGDRCFTTAGPVVPQYMSRHMDRRTARTTTIADTNHFGGPANKSVYCRKTIQYRTNRFIYAHCDVAVGFVYAVSIVLPIVLVVLLLYPDHIVNVTYTAAISYSCI